MKVYRTHTEPQLVQILEGLKTNRTTWRAQLFRLSILKESGSADGLENILMGLIVNQLAEKDGFAFLCHDNDVILFGRAILKKDFDHITEDLEKHIPEETRKKLTSPLTMIFDLGVSWDQFFKFCEDKFKAFQHHQKKSSAFTKPQTPNPTVQGIVLPPEAYQRLLAKGLASRKERKKPCILLVEDDPLSLHMARKALEKNFIIEAAVNAAEARMAYMSHAPDVVFLDIGLPDVNGHTLLGELVSMDRDAFIVMLSANSFQNDILKAMRTGAKGFVGKPFSRAKLLHYISQSPHCAQNVSLSELL